MIEEKVKMSLIIFVLSKPEKLDDLLSAWEAAGASRATILASTGMGRLRQSTMLREDFPLIPGLEDIFRHEETSSRTLFSLVEDEAVVEAVIAATQKVVGDLSQPNTGILMVLPVSQALGLKKCP
jgi:nitrogen regulatory protein PII